jgi:HK97 gp10 family phage protein
MSSPVTMRVEGLSKALKNLHELGGRIKNKGVRRALTAGSKVLVRAASSGAPKQTGTLAKAMIGKIKAYRRGAYLLAIIGAKSRKYANGRNPANYSHLVEFGHRIAVGGALARLKKPKKPRVTRVATGTHKGDVPGNPFMRRAAQAGMRTSEAIIFQIISQEAVAAARALGGTK